MNTLIRFRQAPISVKEIKLNFFAPVEKVTNKNRYKFETKIYEDENFEVYIKGVRLTQIHRDILDIILFYGDTTIEQQIEENVPVRTFTLYKVLKMLGHKNPTKHIGWLKNKIDDLTNATITIKEKNVGDELSFHIIRVAKYSKKLESYVLVIDDLYLAFFEKELSINYKTLLPNILKLKYAVTKMAIRYLLTHSSGINININKLLKKIGVVGGTRNFDIQRKKLLEELQVVGKDFNISLKKMSNDNRKKSDYTIIYERHKEVKVYFPKQNEKEV